MPSTVQIVFLSDDLAKMTPGYATTWMLVAILSRSTKKPLATPNSPSIRIAVKSLALPDSKDP